MRLWACGQRASVVQAQRHVCDPVPYEKRIHDQQRRILFATGRPTRAGLGKGPAQAQRGASPVAKKSILDDSEIRDRLSFTLSRSGIGCFAMRWRFGQHLEAAVSWHSGFRGGAHARPKTHLLHFVRGHVT